MSDVLAAQARRVRAMVAHAFRTVPHYREALGRAGLTPADFRTAEDLARLPIIEPQQLQSDPERFLSKSWPAERCVAVRTGGSTGAPRTILHSPPAVLRNAAHGERDRAPYTPLVGRWGYRELVVISGNSTAVKLHATARSAALLPRRLLVHRRHASMLDPLEQTLGTIDEFRPDVLHSYGSYLAMLFSHLADTGRQFHRPKVVTYSSDGLPDAARRLIQGRFGIPVFGAYQANEALKIGFECPAHRGLHLNIDLYPLRLVDADGCDVPLGQPGEVVVSNLVNDATVLLNYRLGDVAAIVPGPCPCGRTLPVLSFLPGRMDDLIELPSGRMVHPQLLRAMFALEPEVRQYQVVQRSPADLSADVVVCPGADQAAVRQRLATRLAACFGPRARCEVRFVGAIQRTPAGKARAVIRLCRPAAQAP